MYTYLLINLGSILGPFILSFDKKVAFYKSWGPLFAAIGIAGGAFIIWDIFFTEWGVWSFNPKYLSGISAFGLPLGEWLFFFTIPYACIFIYACMNAYVKKDLLGSHAKTINRVLALILLVIGIVFWERMYTAVTFISTAIYLLLHSEVWKSPWMGRFYMGYLVALVPFMIVNGMLTAFPVVQYNDLENLATRIYTIPVEDSMYMMLLLLLTTHFFEIFKARQTAHKANKASLEKNYA